MLFQKAMLAFSGFALCAIGCRVPAQTAPPVDRAVWVQSFKDPDKNGKLNAAFIAANPEVSYQIVRDNWKSIEKPEARAALLTLFDAAENPHLFALLNMGTNDTEGLVKDRAYNLIVNYSFHDWRWNESPYRAWYAQNKDKSPEQAIRDTAGAVVIGYPKLATWERSGVLDQFQYVDFTSDTPLARLRRKIVVDGGIWDIVKRALANPSPQAEREQAQLQEAALNAARGLGPDAEFVRTYVLPFTDKAYSDTMRQAAILTLGSVRAPWVSDKLVQMLAQEYPNPVWESVTTAMARTGDPHNVPPLIAILDSDDSEDTIIAINRALAILTQVPFQWGAGRDADWWRQWWDKNKTQFPADVAALSIPDLHLQNTPKEAGFVRQGKRLRRVDNDPQRTYYLLTPGLVGLKRAEIRPATALVVRGGKESGGGVGLLVVLVGGNGNGENLSEYWMDAITKALHGNYMVALAVAPKWNSKQPAAWITKQNQAAVPEAAFPTEKFVADIVADVAARYPIDPARIFLHGVAEGGIAAYVCSLDTSTPFKGFYILSSSFRSALLPPLTYAKNRRYVIQNSQTDKTVPYWQVAAGASLLKKAGAIVKLSTVSGDQGYKFAGDPWKPIQDAIAWLESGARE